MTEKTDKRLFLRVAEGRVVRREQDGEIWPAEGEWAAPSLFIRRRIADGDLVPVEPAKRKAAERPAGERQATN